MGKEATRRARKKGKSQPTAEKAGCSGRRGGEKHPPRKGEETKGLRHK